MIENTLAYKIKYMLPKPIREFSYKFPIATIYSILLGLTIIASFFDNFFAIIGAFLFTTHLDFILTKIINNSILISYINIITFVIIFYFIRKISNTFKLNKYLHYGIYITFFILNLIWNIHIANFI